MNLVWFCILVFLCLLPERALACVLTGVRIVQRAVWRSGGGEYWKDETCHGNYELLYQKPAWKSPAQLIREDRSHVVRERVKLSVYPFVSGFPSLL